VLLDPYDPAGTAAEYEKAGAAAISVLTEPRFFGGTGADLAAVRRRVGLPILCKDFILDPIQIAHAAAWGADAVLLIVAALNPDTCQALHRQALAAGLDVIVEVHAESELETALGCAGAIIGVNNRDLRTLETRLEVSRRLRRLIPVGRLCISESGLRTAADLAELTALGFDGFLIGESLLRGGQPGPALERLLRPVAP
jgi:indole-3-glycerol phosphate synthase